MEEKEFAGNVIAVVALIMLIVALRVGTIQEAQKATEAAASTKETEISDVLESILGSLDTEETTEESSGVSESTESESQMSVSEASWIETFTEQAKAEAQNGIWTCYLVNVTKLNVRDMAESSGNKVGALKQNEIAYGTGNVSDNGNWVEIAYSDEETDEMATGWVYAKYCLTMQGTLTEIEQWYEENTGIEIDLKNGAEDEDETLAGTNTDSAQSESTADSTQSTSGISTQGSSGSLKLQACSACGGSGRFTCAICGGSGFQTTQYYDAIMGWQSMQTGCSGCGGAGYTVCGSCGGSGWVL